jgi:hypothetical protein
MTCNVLNPFVRHPSEGWGPAFKIARKRDASLHWHDEV